MEKGDIVTVIAMSGEYVGKFVEEDGRNIRRP